MIILTKCIYAFECFNCEEGHAYWLLMPKWAHVAPKFPLVILAHRHVAWANISHTQCTLNTLTDAHISLRNAYYANSLWHTHAQLHIEHTHRYTQKCKQTLCHTHTHTHTHTHAQLHILTETSKQTPSLLTHKLIRTQTQKVRRTHCIATIRHNTAQLVGGEEWRGARDAAEENCQRSVEGTWD